jgi:hypothetical protein
MDMVGMGMVMDTPVVIMAAGAAATTERCFQVETAYSLLSDTLSRRMSSLSQSDWTAPGFWL